MKLYWKQEYPDVLYTIYGGSVYGLQRVQLNPFEKRRWGWSFTRWRPCDLIFGVNGFEMIGEL